jgi:hypothetical protein
LFFGALFCLKFGIFRSRASGNAGATDCSALEFSLLQSAALPDGVFQSRIWGNLAFLEVVWHFNFSVDVFYCLICFWRFIWLLRSCLAFLKKIVVFFVFIWVFSAHLNRKYDYSNNSKLEKKKTNKMTFFKKIYFYGKKKNIFLAKNCL